MKKVITALYINEYLMKVRLNYYWYKAVKANENNVKLIIMVYITEA